MTVRTMSTLRLAALSPLLTVLALGCSSAQVDDTPVAVGGDAAAAGSAASPDPTAGSAAFAGNTSTGSGGMAGSSGSSGIVPVGGNDGGGGSASVAGGAAGSPPAVQGIPAGYPEPTAANAAKCTKVPMTGGFCPGGGAGPVCMQCLFGGTMFGTSETTPTAEGKMLAGNYLVTLKLGGDAAGQTFVSAESSRGLLASTTTAAGQSLDFGFVVNVREMEGQPKHAGGPSGYPGLNLFFSGPSDAPPQVSAIGYALAGAATKPLMVYVAGDSTVCDQTGNEFGGWAQMLPQHFAAPVGISNYANSGASSNFGFWNDIKDHWVAGDWVIIQFGHNDKNSTDAQVQANLERMVSDALAANVTPILVSPPARAQFNGAMVSNQSSLHAAAAAAAAANKKVAYIDLTKLSTAWYNELGSQAAALKFHAHGTDATHTNLAGADKLAALVASEIRSQNLELAKYLR